MPIVNGNCYMNGEYGQGLEQARIGDAFPGLADQSGAGNSWVLDRAHPEKSTVGVYKVFGPFQVRNKPIFTDINENLQDTPPRSKL